MALERSIIAPESYTTLKITLHKLQLRWSNSKFTSHPFSIVLSWINRVSPPQRAQRTLQKKTVIHLTHVIKDGARMIIPHFILKNNKELGCKWYATQNDGSRKVRLTNLIVQKTNELTQEWYWSSSGKTLNPKLLSNIYILSSLLW